MTLEPGAIFAGWRILAEIGSGGIGTVYEAEDAAGGRFALKVFSLDHGNVEFLRKRFLAEGRILAALDHPRIVRVRASGIEAEAGSPYLAMDLVRSASGTVRTLEDERSDGRVTEARAWTWYRDLRAALEYCHAHGVIHRDLKLENALVDATGHAVVTDFGIARIADERKRRELAITTTFIEGETTGTRPVMGTYWYLAPELRRGGEATPASDRYALGVLLFRLLTGMWYEPGTKAFDLLAPYANGWRMLIPALLSDDPSRRVFPESCVTNVRRWPWKWIVPCSLLTLAPVFVILGLAIGRGENVESERSSEREKSVDEKSVDKLEIEAGEEQLEKLREIAPVEKFTVDWDDLKETIAPFGSDLPDDANVRLEFMSLPETATGGRWIAAKPVSRRLYAASVRFLKIKGQDIEGDDSPQSCPGILQALSFCTSFGGVVAIANKAGMKNGDMVRLPTEEELRAAVAAGLLSSEEVTGETVATGLATFGVFGNGKPTGRFRLCIGSRL